MLRSRPECPRCRTQIVPKAGGMPPAMFQIFRQSRSPGGTCRCGARGIALLNVQGHSLREIGRRLGRAASTISRELDRNAATHGGGLAYRATTAQWHADRSARRPKRPSLHSTSPAHLCGRTTYRCRRGPKRLSVPGPAVPGKGCRPDPRKDRRWTKAWSPEQIARRLPMTSDDETMRISHEAIYQALFVQGRGALGRELTAAYELDVRCERPGRARVSGAKALSRQSHDQRAPG